ncbi:Rossmann-like and DUF2520 domain-containing protein [Taibaiella koreensis]|uniref:Rossmann-like and DUF2520 domain-containing protein n=1 Tax=Taibaiella koreensis TaxID=1268548 RepID=UPI000E59B5C2|nr:Rossmann-like and DUF2520 domain-containing protein [Taibaiella koreensis]
MRIVFIGSGNVAHFFATRLQKKGHDIVQVYSRNADHAAALARLCAIPSVTTELSGIVPDADVYILAIKDDALPEVAQQLRFDGKVVIHCAGAVPLDTIAGTAGDLAVIWSLYSIKKSNLPQSDDVPLIVEANTGRALELALSLARDISGTVLETDYAQRQMLHLSAVFVNNFTNHLMAIAQKIGEAHQLPFAILQPIIRQTLEQTAHVLPAESQTGPAVRHDSATIAKHLSLLAEQPGWQQVYAGITASIQQMNPLHT